MTSWNKTGVCLGQDNGEWGRMRKRIGGRMEERRKQGRKEEEEERMKM